jgi:hypothetical protein
MQTTSPQSDPADTTNQSAKPRISRAIWKRARARLTQPSAGIACAVLAAALCGVASLLVRLVPGFYHHHFGGWWSAPRWHTLWVDALLAVVVVWCWHSALRCYDSMAHPTNHRQSSRWWLGPIWLQMGLVLAFGAFVWLQLRPPEQEFVVTEKGVDIHGESYRAIRIESGGREHHAPRPTVAWLERRVGAASERLRAERGKWWTSVPGSYQLAVARAEVAIDGVILRHGHRHVVVTQSKPEESGLVRLLLHGIHSPDSEPSVHVHHADVTIGDQRSQLPFDPEWAGENAFLGNKESPVLLVRVHRDLGTSLAGAALGLLLVSCILIWARVRGSSRSPQ